MLTENTEPDHKYGKVSFSDGYWYHFEDGDNDITVFGSALTAKEKVFINDELMSEARRLTLSSNHEFSYGGAEYRVEFKTLNALTSKVQCTVIKDGETLGAKAISFYDGTPKEVLKRLWPMTLLGFIFGAGGVFVGKSMSSYAFGLGVMSGILGVIGLTLAIVMFKRWTDKS